MQCCYLHTLWGKCLCFTQQLQSNLPSMADMRRTSLAKWRAASEWTTHRITDTLSIGLQGTVDQGLYTGFESITLRTLQAKIVGFFKKDFSISIIPSNIHLHTYARLIRLHRCKRNFSFNPDVKVQSFNYDTLPVTSHPPPNHPVPLQSDLSVTEKFPNDRIFMTENRCLLSCDLSCDPCQWFARCLR